MDTTDSNTFVVNTFPTTKEQIIAYGLALAFTAVSAVAVFGSLAVFGAYVDKKEERAAKKAEAKAAK